MKYFKKELFADINSSDFERQDKALKQWDINDCLYAEYFERIRHRFPESFSDAFFSHGGFHDYEICSLSALLSEKRIELSLFKKDLKSIIIFKDVSDFSISADFDTNNSFESSVVYWENLYEKNKMVFNILLGNGSEINITCDKVKIF